MTPERLYYIDDKEMKTVKRMRIELTDEDGNVINTEADDKKTEDKEAHPLSEGVTVPLIGSLYSVGCSIPPVVAYPITEVNNENESDDLCYVTPDPFTVILQHFTTHAKPSQTFPVLLLHNNNTTHITIEAMDFADKHGVIIITFPPHVPIPDRTSLTLN